MDLVDAYVLTEKVCVLPSMCVYEKGEREKVVKEKSSERHQNEEGMEEKLDQYL